MNSASANTGNTRLCLILILSASLFGCGDSKARLQPSEWSEKERHVPSSREIFGYVRDLTSFGYRRTGTPAVRKSVEYIRDRFNEFGLKKVSIENHDACRWESLACSLELEGKKIPSFPMPTSMRVDEFGKFSLGDKGTSADIVYVGAGSEDDYKKIDVKNKIVVSDILFYDVEWRDFKGMSYFTHDPEGTLKGGMKHENPYISRNFPSNYYRAQNNGAAAFVGVLVDYFDKDTYYNEDLSLSSEFSDKGFMKIPGLYVGKSEGMKMKNAISGKTPGAKANLRFAVNITRAKAFNVMGYIPGKSGDIILIHSHHDSPFTGAVQDASGVAVVLAMAEYFSKAPAEFRDKTLMFASLDTHFTGYTANKGFIKNRQEKGENIILDVCIEHIGLEAKNAGGKLVLTGNIEPRGIFISENRDLIAAAENAVLKNDFRRFALVPTFSPLGVCSDAFHLHKSGVPVVSLISPPLYIYDPEDTLDKVAVNELGPTASVLIDIVDRADNMPSAEVRRTSLILSHRIKYYWWLVGKIVEMIFG